ncbi:MAG: hypothetical protein IT491_12660 [Gammaproteobacteria bacterium]|jgi:hypothetical protein|nr:hypothetical protein [Gammaproteobacteria bacterium]
MPIPFPRAMWSRPVLAGLILATLITGCATAPPPLVDAGPAAIGKLSDKAKQEQQQAILKIRNQTIKQIYKLRPAVQKEVDASVGYGVFEVNGLNAVLAESHGRGVVVDKRGRTTYMQLARTDVGPKATVLPYRQVLVFRDPKRMQQFVASGLPADASRDVSIKVYKLNEKGVSVQADWGARYFRDPDLN